MRSRVALLAALVALCLLPAARLAAQDPPAWERLAITLMPQYDDPRLLILYEATLERSGEVAFGIPTGVELASAAYREADGRLVEVEARFEARSDGRRVVVESPGRELRLALYQDVIPPTIDRFVDFTLPAQDVAVGELEWRVVYPLGASELRSEPPMRSTGSNHLGMATFSRSAGALTPGSTSMQTIEYRRVSNEPSLALNAPPAAPASARRWLPYALAGLMFLAGLLLVARGVRASLSAG